MNWNDQDEGPVTSLGRPVQRANFVAPAPIVPVQRVEILPPAQHELTPVQPAQTVQRLDTSHVDRAKGFTLSTVPLSLTLGAVALVLAVVTFGVPLFSGAALLTLGAVFALTWLAAYAWNQSASPDGVMLWQVLLHYRLLRNEQRARHARMDRYREDEE